MVRGELKRFGSILDLFLSKHFNGNTILIRAGVKDVLRASRVLRLYRLLRHLHALQGREQYWCATVDDSFEKRPILIRRMCEETATPSFFDSIGSSTTSRSSPESVAAVPSRAWASWSIAISPSTYISALDPLLQSSAAVATMFIPLPFARGTFVYGLNALVHRRGRQHMVFFSALDPLLRTMSAVVIIQLTTYYRLFVRKTLRSLLTIQRTSFRIIVGAFSRFSPGTIRRVYGRCPRLFAAFSQRSDAPLDYTYTILWIAGHFRDLFLLMVLVYTWIFSVGRWYLPVHHLTLKNDWYSNIHSYYGLKPS